MEVEKLHRYKIEAEKNAELFNFEHYENSKSFVFPHPLKSVLLGKKNYYLTTNLFYSGINHHVRKFIVGEACKYLMPISKLPKIEKMNIFFSWWLKSHKDLDNRTGFWCKVALDYLQKQYKIENDNTEVVTSIGSRYMGKDDLLIISFNYDN